MDSHLYFLTASMLLFSRSRVGKCISIVLLITGLFVQTANG